ncbi:MAG: DUF1640 domain-containing protein, partial [Candidatus Magasanikbacteria bacterium]|nr:DUF1640 domain-containing protein [Candidatus Magasanikbacteria bacterium]
MEDSIIEKKFDDILEIVKFIKDHGATSDDLQKLRAELKGEINGLRTELKGEIDALRNEM